MLCRRPSSAAIPPDLAKKVKARLYEVLAQYRGGSHEGEVFVRRVSAAEAQRAAPGRCVIPHIEEKVVLKISMTGHHQPGTLRAVTRRLFELGLDVAACDMVEDVRGQEDYAVFYATFKADKDYGDVWLFRNKVHSALQSLVQERDPSSSVFVEILPDAGGRKHGLAQRRGSLAGRRPGPEREYQAETSLPPAITGEEDTGSATPATQARRVALGMSRYLPQRRMQLSGLSPAFASYQPSVRPLARSRHRRRMGSERRPLPHDDERRDYDPGGGLEHRIDHGTNNSDSSAAHAPREPADEMRIESHYV